MTIREIYRELLKKNVSKDTEARIKVIVDDWGQKKEVIVPLTKLEMMGNGIILFSQS